MHKQYNEWEEERRTRNGPRNLSDRSDSAIASPLRAIASTLIPIFSSSSLWPVKVIEGYEKSRFQPSIEKKKNSDFLSTYKAIISSQQVYKSKKGTRLIQNNPRDCNQSFLRKKLGISQASVLKIDKEHQKALPYQGNNVVSCQPG